MRRCIVDVVFCGCLFLLSSHPVFAVNTVLAGHFSGSEPRLSLVQGTCTPKYQLIPFTVSGSGNYDLSSIYSPFASNSGLDVQFAIYDPEFVPLFPEDNLLVERNYGSDREGPPVSVSLQADHQYSLLILAPCDGTSTGNWVIAFRRGAGGVISSATTQTLDEFTSGHIDAPGGPKVDTGCNVPSAFVEMNPFQVAHTGQYQFISDVSSNDGVCVRIYSKAFDPAHPLANLVSVDHDWYLHTTAYLEEGKDYYLVVQPISDDEVDYFFVTAPVNDIPMLGSSMTGNWANPETPGQGFFIEVLEGGLNEVFLGWLTFDLENNQPGNPGVGNSGQRWLTAVGHYPFYTIRYANLQFEVTSDAFFNQALPAARQLLKGTIDLAFQDCDNALITYDLGTGSVTDNTAGSFRIRRVSSANWFFCDFDPFDPFTDSKGRTLSGSWSNPDAPGQGFFIEVMEGTNQVAIDWFTYDNSALPGSVGAAGQRWLTAFGPVEDNRAELKIEVTSGGDFNQPLPVPVQALDGTMTLEIFDCENGQITFNLETTGSAGVIPIKKVSNGNIAACQRWLSQAGLPTPIARQP